MSEVRRSSRVRNQQKQIAETKPAKLSKAKRTKKEELVDTDAFKKIVKKTKIPKSLLEETAPSDNESESGLTFIIKQIQTVSYCMIHTVDSQTCPIFFVFKNKAPFNFRLTG